MMILYEGQYPTLLDAVLHKIIILSDAVLSKLLDAILQENYH